MPLGNRRAEQQKAGSHFASSWLGRLTGKRQRQSNPLARGRAADWLAVASWLAEEILGRRRARGLAYFFGLLRLSVYCVTAFGPQGSTLFDFLDWALREKAALRYLVVSPSS